jgi:CBS domain-containing protein
VVGNEDASPAGTNQRPYVDDAGSGRPGPQAVIVEWEPQVACRLPIVSPERTRQTTGRGNRSVGGATPFESQCGGRRGCDVHAIDVMSRPVLAVRSDDSIEQATAQLTTHNVSAAPVVDSAGDLVGMVSEGDLMIGRVPGLGPSGGDQAIPAEGPEVVADVMSTNVIAMAPDADLADVAEAMMYNDVRSVPVVDDTAGLIGIVSRHDVLRSLVRTDDALQSEVQHRLDGYADGQRRWSVSVSNGAVTITGRFSDTSERRVVDVLAHTVPGVIDVRISALQ